MDWTLFLGLGGVVLGWLLSTITEHFANRRRRKEALEDRDFQKKTETLERAMALLGVVPPGADKERYNDWIADVASVRGLLQLYFKPRVLATFNHAVTGITFIAKSQGKELPGAAGAKEYLASMAMAVSAMGLSEVGLCDEETVTERELQMKKSQQRMISQIPDFEAENT